VVVWVAARLRQEYFVGHKEVPVTQLRQKMLEELQRRNYAQSTVKGYLRIVQDFAQYFHQPPDKLGPDHLRQYQAHLFQDKKLNAGTVQQYVAALRFFFNKTLKRHYLLDDIPMPKRHRKLPEIMQTLASKYRGYWNYYGVRGNSKSLEQFFQQTRQILFKWLNRRGGRHKMTWEKFNKMAERLPLTPEMNAGQAHDALSRLGADLIGGRQRENMTLAGEKALLACFAKAAGAGEMLNIHDLKAAYEQAMRKLQPVGRLDELIEALDQNFRRFGFHRVHWTDMRSRQHLPTHVARRVPNGLAD